MWTTSTLLSWASSSERGIGMIETERLTGFFRPLGRTAEDSLNRNPSTSQSFQMRSAYETQPNDCRLAKFSTDHLREEDSRRSSVQEKPYPTSACWRVEAHGRQRLLQIGDQVIDIFDPHR